jgi:hypothetical protein
VIHELVHKLLFIGAVSLSLIKLTNVLFDLQIICIFLLGSCTLLNYLLHYTFIFL